MYELALPLVVGLVILALLFDFLNGVHDAANAIATVVATQLIGPIKAVAFAAFFNFAAYFLTILFPELHKVAETIGAGLIDKELITPAVIFGALMGAMAWNIFTWVKGVPSSSSHALIGGVIGAGVAHAGFPSIEWVGLNKTLIAIVLSPVLGMLLSMAVMLVCSWLLRNATARHAERGFHYLHLLSAAAYSTSHGLNDAQKTMGVIAVLLYSTGHLTGGFHVPHWVAVACYTAMAIGTMMGGWKIIETMGGRITKLSQFQGFSASASGSVVIFVASLLGIPVSTTQTITGSIIGAGVAKRASAVHWGVASSIVVAWLVTIPASALAGAAFYYLTKLF